MKIILIKFKHMYKIIMNIAVDPNLTIKSDGQFIFEKKGKVAKYVHLINEYDFKTFEESFDFFVENIRGGELLYEYMFFDFPCNIKDYDRWELEKIGDGYEGNGRTYNPTCRNKFNLWKGEKPVLILKQMDRNWDRELMYVLETEEELNYIRENFDFKIWKTMDM